MARIAYASAARVEGPVYGEMERIRAAALRHNVPQGVHTALLHQSGWFLQWKEGPREAIERLMDRVARDPRHAGLRVVHSSRGPRLLDGPWSMAIARCDDAPEDMAERVARVREAFESGRQLSLSTAWRRMSTPLRHPGAQRHGDPDAFQRVLACSAAGTAAFDLAHWLAGQHRQEVVHRRLAGARDLDVATDYVDFEEGARLLRLVAMARRGLGVPLARAFMPDYAHALLLLSGDSLCDLALVRRMAEATAHQAGAPVLVGVARDPRAHRGPCAAARRAGLIYRAVEADPASPPHCWAAVQPQLALWRHAAGAQSPVVPLSRWAA